MTNTNNTKHNISGIISSMPKMLRTILLCILAVVLNMLTVDIFYKQLSLPLFFDTIFTVAIVFHLGLVPGLCVSLGYNLINGFEWVFLKKVSDPFIFFYSICGVLIVFATWLIARKKQNFKVAPLVTLLYLLLITLLSAACTIIAGGIIDYFHYVCYDVPDMMNPIKTFTDSFVQQRFSLLISCILAQIPVSVLDRLLATFAGYGVYRLVERIIDKRKI